MIIRTLAGDVFKLIVDEKLQLLIDELFFCQHRDIVPFGAYENIVREGKPRNDRWREVGRGAWMIVLKGKGRIPLTKHTENGEGISE